MMDGISLFWIIIYILATLMFFGTAGVITVLGARDLRDLLGKSDKR